MPIEITPKNAGQTFQVKTGTRHKFVLRAFRGAVLDVEDVHFHFDSAVFLPELGAAAGGPGAVSGLAALAAIYKHAEEDKARKLLLAGHTDRSGAEGYNLELSRLRAENVLHLLLGARDEWVKVSRAKNKVEDAQEILAWTAGTRGWDCDPGQADGVAGPGTTEATRKFQKRYNTEFKATIAEDGAVGAQTWGAFYDLYRRALAEACGTDDAGLSAKQQQLSARFVDGARKVIGCGENHPLTANTVANRRSRIDRRVEVVFFAPGEEPPLDCHPSASVCKPESCRLYDPALYTLVPLAIQPITNARLSIAAVDANFAPGAETLQVRYSIASLADKTVKLQVLSDKYADKVLFERELTKDEKADGAGKTLTWDGKIGAGARAGRFASPSLSPLEVKLAGGGKTAEAEFEILVHSLEWKLGDFERGIFDDGADTTKGQQQRLKQLGYYHGDVNGSAADAKFKKAVEWFQKERDATAATKGTVGDSTRDALKNAASACLEGGALPAAGAKAKVFVSGAFFYETDADLNPGGNPRFTAEKAFWGDGVRIPVCAKIYLKKKDGSRADCPKSVWGTRVLFDYEDPADDAVLAGKQKDYCDKALDYDKAKTVPTGDNCHKDRGGKRGDAITLLFPESSDPAKFPCKVAKAQHRGGAVVSTAREEDDDQQGYAGVVFSPSRMGGDGYLLHAFLHTEKDLDTDAEKATAPDVEIKTGKLYVWRKVRVNQYLHKTNAVINAIDLATVNAEMAKAYMEFAGELAKKDVDQATWEATVTGALTSDADFATIGVVDYASLNTVDFKTHAQYRAAGGALGAAAYTNLCRNKTENWLGRVMKAFAADQFHGMTVIRVANGHNNFFTNSGLAPIGEGCFVWWPKATYDAKSYVVEKYAAHEMGHCLYLRHHYTGGPTSGAPATWPASDNPNDHDEDDPGCAMSYYRTDWHLCGKCILKLRGWDESALSKDDDANRKV